MTPDVEDAAEGDTCVLGEWTILVRCPRLLPVEVAEAVVVEVEIALAGLGDRLSSDLTERYRELLAIQLEP